MIDILNKILTILDSDPIKYSLAFFGGGVILIIIGALLTNLINNLKETISHYIWMKWRRIHPPMPECRCEFCKYHSNNGRCDRWIDSDNKSIRFTPNDGFCYLGEYLMEKEIGKIKNKKGNKK